MPYVTGGGPRLYYERRGSGEPMLWITGFTISAAVFEPVLDLYASRLDCVSYDNRGAGRSGRPWRVTSMPELAADAVRVLDAAGIESAHVYGLSMGGMIAQELALRFPERVRGLILGGTTPGGPGAVLPTVTELTALFGGALGALREPGRPWLGSMLFSREWRRENPRRERELLAFFDRHRSPPQGIAAHWWASVYHDTLARLSDVQAPTLVVHGAHDAMAPPANARLLASRIPDAELALVAGSGHACLLEAPELCRDQLFDWLDRKAPIPAGHPRSALGRRLEPLTRQFGLPVGALRTGGSLVSTLTGAGRRGG